MLQSTIKELSELETKTENVKKAIEHVTGVPFEVWKIGKRQIDYICREIYLYHISKIDTKKNITPRMIQQELCKGKSFRINSHIEAYFEDYKKPHNYLKCGRFFKDIADNVYVMIHKR